MTSAGVPTKTSISQGSRVSQLSLSGVPCFASLLGKMTRTTRSFYVVLVLALVAVSSVALVPHHDTEDARCVICKVGSQPFEQVRAVSAPVVDTSLTRALPPAEAPACLLPFFACDASRAPPA